MRKRKKKREKKKREKRKRKEKREKKRRNLNQILRISEFEVKERGEGRGWKINEN